MSDWWYKQPSLTTSYWVSFIWGLSEATFFFLIPDIYLTRIALTHYKQSLLASIYATIGALIGGIIMYYWGRYSPESAAHFLLQVPAISSSLLSEVDHSMITPLQSLLKAPIYGIPYKLYAVALGRIHTPISLFLIISFVARLLRFLLAISLTAVAVKIVRNRSPKFYFISHFIVWLIIYGMYFHHFGF